MRKSTAWLLHGQVCPSGGSSSISGSLSQSGYSKVCLPKGQSHHLKYPYTYCCLLQKQKANWILESSLSGLSLITKWIWIWFGDLWVWIPTIPGVLFRDQIPVSVLVRLKALDGETCVLSAGHGPCHIVGLLEMVVELANELITDSRQLAWFTDKSPDSGTTHLDSNPEAVWLWADDLIFQWLGFPICTMGVTSIYISRLLAGLNELVCVKNREQGQAYNKGSFTEFPRLWQRLA